MKTLLLQQAKDIVKAHHHAISTAKNTNIEVALQQHTHPEWLWRGFEPFNIQIGAKAVANSFWQPFLLSMSAIKRREDIFFAGYNEIDNFDSIWVVSMGHLFGLYDANWLGITATKKMAFLRYCEFNRIAGDKIVETAFYFDIPHFMRQAGITIFAKQRAAHLVQPGPMNHNGCLYAKQNIKEGCITLEVINAMINELGTWKSNLSLSDELSKSWHKDMIWWGPEGIGASYTIKRYAKQHAQPFRYAFKDRSTTTHIARLAEGYYGGFFGWPNFTAINANGFLGMPPSKVQGEFRVIDIYRRRGRKLAENWVFIDILHWLKQQGRDVLAEISANK